MDTNKIESSLKALAEKNPDLKFNVLMVCQEDTDPDELDLEDCFKPMKNIIAGTLTGRRILVLTSNEKIIFIEPDMDISMLT